MTARASHQPPGRYRFRHLARMEWIKLRSLRSTWLTLALAVAAPAGIAVATGGGSTTSGGMSVSNTLTGMLIGVLLIGVAGVLAMTGEYASGTISATFASAPRRLRVLAAKAAVVGAAALVTGEAAAFLSFFAGGMTLRHGITVPALSQPGVLRAIVLTGASLSPGRPVRARPRDYHPAHRRRDHRGRRSRLRRRHVHRPVGLRHQALPAALHRQPLTRRHGAGLPPRHGVLLAVALERTRLARRLRRHRHAPRRADPRPARRMSRCRRHRWPPPFSGAGRLKNTRPVHGCEPGACSLTACAGNEMAKGRPLRGRPFGVHEGKAPRCWEITGYRTN